MDGAETVHKKYTRAARKKPAIPIIAANKLNCPVFLWMYNERLFIWLREIIIPFSNTLRNKKANRITNTSPKAMAS